MSQLKFAELARQDLQDIHDYIAKDNMRAASSFIERLHKCCYLLADKPNIGRKRIDIAHGLKSITEGNYLILYHDIIGGIMIVRVFHTARDIKKILKLNRS
jgi:toxin ParE1/3/4